MANHAVEERHEAPALNIHKYTTKATQFCIDLRPINLKQNCVKILLSSIFLYFFNTEGQQNTKIKRELFSLHIPR